MDKLSRRHVNRRIWFCEGQITTITAVLTTRERQTFFFLLSASLQPLAAPKALSSPNFISAQPSPSRQSTRSVRRLQLRRIISWINCTRYRTAYSSLSLNLRQSTWFSYGLSPHSDPPSFCQLLWGMTLPRAVELIRSSRGFSLFHVISRAPHERVSHTFKATPHHITAGYTGVSGLHRHRCPISGPFLASPKNYGLMGYTCLTYTAYTLLDRSTLEPCCQAVYPPTCRRTQLVSSLVNVSALSISVCAVCLSSSP